MVGLTKMVSLLIILMAKKCMASKKLTVIIMTLVQKVLMTVKQSLPDCG